MRQMIVQQFKRPRGPLGRLDAGRGAERNIAFLTDAGFKNARIEMLDLHPAATCVLAEA